MHMLQLIKDNQKLEYAKIKQTSGKTGLKQKYQFNANTLRSLALAPC